MSLNPAKPTMTAVEVERWSHDTSKKLKAPTLGHAVHVLRASGLRTIEIGLLLWPDTERHLLSSYVYNAEIKHVTESCFYCKRREVPA